MAKKTLIISPLADKSEFRNDKTRTITQLTQSNSTPSTTTIRYPIATAMDRNTCNEREQHTNIICDYPTFKIMSSVLIH
jgi:hypothetical protein